MGAPKKRARAVAAKLQAGKLPRRFPPAEDVEPNVSARTLHCLRLMVAGKWQDAHTHHRLAEAWKLAPATIRGYAAEASRMYKALVSDEEREVLRALLGETFRRIARKAERMGRLEWALSALEMFGRYAGIEPQKVTRSEITGKNGGPVAIASPVIMIPPEDDDGEDSGGTGSAPAAPAAP